MTMTPEERAEIKFDGFETGFDWNNEDWALAHLPWVRAASMLLGRDDAQCLKVFADMVPSGIVPDMLEEMTRTKAHLQGLVDLMENALTRSFLSLERLGFSPDCPPPDSTVQ